jgi:hypothetical protein
VIFGIGLSKTGTTSLFAALDLLGFRAGTYRHMRLRGMDEWFRGDFSTDYLAGYDALTDLPLAAFVPQLDERYPGSKFVLTVRELDSWLGSARAHFAAEPETEFGRLAHLATYGATAFHEGRFRYVHATHARSVAWYFRSRPDALLTLDVVAGEGWEKLCPFLGCPVPEVPFPHVQPGYRLPHESEPDPPAGQNHSSKS